MESYSSSNACLVDEPRTWKGTILDGGIASIDGLEKIRAGSSRFVNISWNATAGGSLSGDTLPQHDSQPLNDTKCCWLVLIDERLVQTSDHAKRLVIRFVAAISSTESCRVPTTAGQEALPLDHPTSVDGSTKSLAPECRETNRPTCRTPSSTVATRNQILLRDSDGTTSVKLTPTNLHCDPQKRNDLLHSIGLLQTWSLSPNLAICDWLIVKWPRGYSGSGRPNGRCLAVCGCTTQSQLWCCSDGGFPTKEGLEMCRHNAEKWPGTAVSQDSCARSCSFLAGLWHLSCLHFPSWCPHPQINTGNASNVQDVSKPCPGHVQKAVLKIFLNIFFEDMWNSGAWWQNCDVSSRTLLEMQGSLQRNLTCTRQHKGNQGACEPETWDCQGARWWIWGLAPVCPPFTWIKHQRLAENGCTSTTTEARINGSRKKLLHGGNKPEKGSRTHKVERSMRKV